MQHIRQSPSVNHVTRKSADVVGIDQIEGGFGVLMELRWLEIKAGSFFYILLNIVNIVHVSTLHACIYFGGILHCCLKDLGHLPHPKCLLSMGILGMWNKCPHPYTAMLHMSFWKEPFKIIKVTSQLQLSHVLLLSLYSIVISVPDPYAQHNPP